jgi:hypothetical protein
VPVHGGGEASAEDLEAVEQALTAELAELRERRRKAQRDIAQAGVLRLAIERTARDRSSGTTEEIEHTRDRAQQVLDEIGDLVGEMDNRRILFIRMREAYPAVQVPPRLSAAFAEEAAWRETVNADERSVAFRLQLPPAGELR